MTSQLQSTSASSEDDLEDDSASLEDQWHSNPANQGKLPPDADNPGATSDPSNRPTAPIQKRRRVTRACDECRRKKIKCDGKQPCTHCTVYSYECTYDQPSNRRRNPAPQYVEALEVKLQRAEAILKSILPQVDLEDPSIDEQFPSGASSSHQDESQGRDSRRYSKWPSQKDFGKVVDGEKDSMLESMVQSTGSLDLDDEGYWDFYGHSSGRAFLTKMREQLGDLIGKPDNLGLPQFRSRDPHGALPSPSSSLVGSPPALKGNSTSELPPKECARMLCGNALDDACAILRFVHQPTFYSMLNRIYDKSSEDYNPEDIKFVPLLYSTIALGSLFATAEQSELQAHGLANAIDQGTHWFRVARSLIDITDCRDLTSLQTMLFMILFLQSSSRLSTCYSHIGIALRSAVRMGLHRSVPNAFNPVEQELRKRIFWSIKKLDTYAGAMLGLPRMLNDEDADQEFPVEVDDDCITTTGILSMPPGKISLMAGFNAHTRIVEILQKTVKYIYPLKGPKGKSGRSYIVSHARIREIEQDLQTWSDQLPEAFRPGGDAPKEFIRIQHLLRMAYAHIEMFLYRPFLHYVSHDVQSKSLDKRSYACAAACVSVARNIVHLSTEMKAKGLLIGSYWFYMYTTFFSIIALVFYVLENPHSAASADILRDAQEGRDTLAGLAQRSLAAQKCTSMLTDLFGQLPERLKGAKMNMVSQKKRQAPSSVIGEQGQALQSAPELKDWRKPNPEIPVRRSNTSPPSRDNWKTPSRPYEAPNFQQQIPHSFEVNNFGRPTLDILKPPNSNTASLPPNAVNGPLPATPPFTMATSTAVLGVPDLSAVMFPSEDPFAYPNQPITTLESQRSVKDEELGSMYNIDPHHPPSTNSAYQNLNGNVYGPVPTYAMPNQSPAFQMDGLGDAMSMTGNNDSQQTDMNFGSRWSTQAPNQGLTGTSNMPVDQLYGEDWGGWMNQGYRQ